MKKIIILIILLLLPTISLFALGAIESKNSNFIPQASANSVINLASTYSDTQGGDLFSFVSCIDNIDTTKTDGVFNYLSIKQTDSNGLTLNNGNQNTFYFIKTDNQTVKQPFQISYIRKLNTFNEFVGTNSQTTEAKKIYSTPVPFAQMKSFKNYLVSKKSFHDANFYIELKGEPLDSKKILPGEYEAKLTIEYLHKDSPTGKPYIFKQDLYLNAVFKQEISDTGAISQYTFSINPTPESYNINLRTTTTPIDIANIKFYSSITMADKELTTTQGNNRYKIKISSNADHNASTTADSYIFRKSGTENMEATPQNSIKYTITGQRNGAPLTIKVPWVNKNAIIQSSALFGKTIYLNEFKLYKNITINLDSTADRNKLTAGQYSSTLYYFVISNT